MDVKAVQKQGTLHQHASLTCLHSKYALLTTRIASSTLSTSSMLTLGNHKLNVKIKKNAPVSKDRILGFIYDHTSASVLYLLLWLFFVEGGEEEVKNLPYTNYIGFIYLTLSIKFVLKKYALKFCAFTWPFTN